MVTPMMVNIATPMMKMMRYGIQCPGQSKIVVHTHHEEMMYPMNMIVPINAP